MSDIILLGGVKPEEIIINLLKFYKGVEEYLSTRIGRDIYSNLDKIEGAKEVLEIDLRRKAMSLKDIFPGVGIKWDCQIDVPPIYSSSSIALVDLVDGSGEYLREGTNVTSHLGIYRRENDKLGDLQLGIVSYPFHRFRVISVGEGDNGNVYYLSFAHDILDRNINKKFEKGRQNKPKIKTDLSRLNIVDRYTRYNQEDNVRNKLDLLRNMVMSKAEVRGDEGSYIVNRGSVAKTIVDVALGVTDVAILKHPERDDLRVPPHDYLTPSKILENVEGVFTDLEGNNPDGMKAIRGFIAAGNKEIYDMFYDFVFGG